MKAAIKVGCAVRNVSAVEEKSKVSKAIQMRYGFDVKTWSSLAQATGKRPEKLRALTEGLQACQSN